MVVVEDEEEVDVVVVEVDVDVVVVDVVDAVTEIVFVKLLLDSLDSATVLVESAKTLT